MAVKVRYRNFIECDIESELTTALGQLHGTEALYYTRWQTVEGGTDSKKYWEWDEDAEAFQEVDKEEIFVRAAELLGMLQSQISGVADGTKFLRDDFTWDNPESPSGSGHEIQEGGTPLPTEPALNFDADDFNITDNPSVSTNVEINESKWATRTFAESLVTGLWDDRGNFDASVNAYPSSGGSGTAGAILKGDIWTISVAGTLPTGQVVEVGDTVRALVDTPGNTQANWSIQQNNIGYTAENSANKTDTMAGNTASSTKYLSAKGVYDWVTGAFIGASLAALSVLGNPTNATANASAITASADHQILRRSGTTVGFGSIDLSQSGAVGTSILGSNNGGAGAVNGILKANGSGVVSAAVSGTDFLSPSAAWLLASGGTLTGHNTIAGNFDKYFTGTGGFVIGHSSLSNANSRLQVRGTGSTTNILALFENSTGSARLTLLDNGSATFSNTINWQTGAGSINHLLGPTDQTFAIAAPVDRGITITAGARSASSAGSITISAGSADNTGGTTTIQSGTGTGFGSSGTLILRSATPANGTSGAVNISTGTGGNPSGLISLITGNGQSTGQINLLTGTTTLTGASTGAITLKTGAGTTNNGSSTGSIDIWTGDGATTGGAIGGGTSGYLTIKTGIGAIGSGSGSGGSAGTLSILGGNGGAIIGTINNNVTGGAGSSLIVTSGNGGAASTSGTGIATGGAGGNITFTTGAGGTATGGATNNTGARGSYTFRVNGGTNVFTINGFGNSDFTQLAQTTSWGSVLKTTAGAHTGLTAATEFVSQDFTGATWTWIDGTVATQRFNFFRGYTLNRTTTSATFTHAYNVYIADLTAGTGVTITNRWSLGLAGNLRVEGTRVNMANLPTSSAGLAAGDLWNNGGVINIV